MNSEALFSRTAPLKLFFLAAIPGAVSMLASALYQTVDGVFVGHFLGSTAFAAVNLAMPFVIINFSLADLIGVGAAVPISICLGRQEKEEANNIFTCAVLMIVGTGVLIGAALFLSAPLVIRLMGADGEFAELAVQYMQVYALCSPVTTIVFAMDNFLRICGFIRGSMFLNILMSGLSALLEFLFLFVLGWGVWAAALATCTGMMVCAVLALIPFLRKKALLRFVRPHFHGQMIRQIIACGCPTFLNNIAGRITSILMNAILVRLGGVQRVAADLAGKLHVFQRGQVLHQVVELEHKAHVIPAVGGQLPGGKAAHVAAVQPDVALVAVVHAAQNIQQGGLARTGGPHDDAELALVHIEIQVVGGSDLHTAGLVIFTDIFKLHKMLHGVFPFCQNAKYFNLNIA